MHGPQIHEFNEFDFPDQKTRKYAILLICGCSHGCACYGSWTIEFVRWSSSTIFHSISIQIRCFDTLFKYPQTMSMFLPVRKLLYGMIKFWMSTMVAFNLSLSSFRWRRGGMYLYTLWRPIQWSSAIICIKLSREFMCTWFGVYDYFFIGKSWIYRSLVFIWIVHIAMWYKGVFAILLLKSLTSFNILIEAYFS